jgi:hypothetical protein
LKHHASPGEVVWFHDPYRNAGTDGPPRRLAGMAGLGRRISSLTASPLTRNEQLYTI